MTVNAFFLAQQASVANGLMSVTGGCVTQFKTATYPSQVNVSAVVVLAAVPGEDEVVTTLLLKAVDEYGTTVGNTYEGSLRLPRWGQGSPAGLPVQAPCVVPLGITVPGPGLYTVILEVDGEDVAETTFQAAFSD